MQLSVFDKREWLHPSHRGAMNRIAVFVLLLALVQFLVWAAPASSHSISVTGYLPLHVLFETVSIVISMLVFAVGWNSRSRSLPGNIVLLACLFFATGLLDLSHTLAYKGMPAFVTENDAEKQLYFWLSARFLASIALLIVAIRSWRPLASALTRYLLLGALVAVTAIINWLVVFHQNLLPHIFIPGVGLTPLKKNLEYLFITINILSACVLWVKMRKPQPFNAPLLFGAVCIMAMGEFYFTLYTTMTGSYNVLGHVYKVISYLFIYRAIVVETIESPYNKLQEARQSLALALQASNTGLWDWHLSDNQVSYSPEWKAQLGYLPDELDDHFSTWESLLHPEEHEVALEKVKRFIESNQTIYESEFRMRHRDGSYRWMLARGEKQYDSSGRAIRLVGSQIDISNRKLDEQHIRQLANFDMLTGLPNRLLLNDRVGKAISAAQRDQTRLGVLFLDLDHFKNVNDILGHLIGDELLIQVSRRLSSVVRDKDTVSRMGGGEFVLLLPDSDVEGVAMVARKLLDAISQPYRIGENEMTVTVSIGIAMYPEDGADFDVLYKHADIAMYRAKHDGRNSYRFFTQEMQLYSARTLQLESALRQALERNQFTLHYQPQMDIIDKRVIGAEALLRWHHPELGTVSPAEFIPIAESSGQIIQIGEWVLRTAVKQMRVWQDSGLPAMVVAVNLSAVQFRHADLPGLVTSILDEAEVHPGCLELELTEGVTMENTQHAIAVMDDLHARGVRMSIDDFGTGYSSLSHLKKFKVYKLKIDQSFVRDINVDADDKAIVSAIIQMSGSLGFRTIAEGVETAEQLAFLLDGGCNEVQGYYFSKPLPAEQFEAFIRMH